MISSNIIDGCRRTKGILFFNPPKEQQIARQSLIQSDDIYLFFNLINFSRPRFYRNEHALFGERLAMTEIGDLLKTASFIFVCSSPT